MGPTPKPSVGLAADPPGTLMGALLERRQSEAKTTLTNETTKTVCVIRDVARKRRATEYIHATIRLKLLLTATIRPISGG